VLQSVAQTRLPQPNLTVRYHRHIDPAFFDEAIEVMKLGTGMPAFNNDEVIIPSFIEKGSKKRMLIITLPSVVLKQRSLVNGAIAAQG